MNIQASEHCSGPGGFPYTKLTYQTWYGPKFLSPSYSYKLIVGKSVMLWCNAETYVLPLSVTFPCGSSSYYVSVWTSSDYVKIYKCLLISCFNVP
jgi:hypothetical protein